MTRVLAVAHFPPPVHGMAIAIDRLVTELEDRCDVRRTSIAAPALQRSPRYHLVRIGRVVRALGVMAKERFRTRTLIVTCDANGGMVYTAAVTLAGRLLGYDMHLQHHVYGYITRRSALLARLVEVLGDRCEHLVTCPRMQADFVARYPGARTRVVGVAGGIAVADDDRRPPGDRLVLGFLGNVTLDKGIDVAVETARAAAAADVPVELRVAGPVIDGAADDLLSEAVADGRIPITVLGPVGAAERDRFLDDLDVFLFPSRYVHESFGLTAWEAMARGVPVVARTAGCLTALAVDDGGLVTDAGEDEVARAVEALRRWWKDPESLRVAGVAARRRAAAEIASSARQVEGLCAEVAGAARPDIDSIVPTPTERPEEPSWRS